MLLESLTVEAKVVPHIEIRFRKVDFVANTINPDAMWAASFNTDKLRSPRNVPELYTKTVRVVSRTSLCLTG